MCTMKFVALSAHVIDYILFIMDVIIVFVHGICDGVCVCKYGCMHAHLCVPIHVPVCRSMHKSMCHHVSLNE